MTNGFKVSGPASMLRWQVLNELKILCVENTFENQYRKL